MPLEPVQVDLSRLTTRQSLSRYNLDSRLDNVINNGVGLESVYGQRLVHDLAKKKYGSLQDSDIGLLIKDGSEVRSMFLTSIGRDVIDTESPSGGVNKGNAFVCVGSRVYKIFGDSQEPWLCGYVNNALGPVHWAESQNQNTAEVFLYLTDKSISGLFRLNILDIYPAIQPIGNELPYVNGSSTEKAKPAFISFRGHRLLLSCENSTQFFFSVLNPDGAARGGMFPAANFYATETKADRTVRVIGLDVVYAFGSQTAEVWRDNNDAYNPYTTSINGNRLEGMLFPDVVALRGNELYYFDNYRRLCRMSGGRHEVLSDRAMERAWDGKLFSNAFTIYANGCFIACFQDSAGFTIGYNTRSNSVSELSCLKNVRAAQGGMLCSRDGKLCEFDDSSCTMAGGEVISKSVQFEVLNSHNHFSLRLVEIDYSMQTVPDGSPLNNQAFLFVSPDGLEWSDARVISLDSHEKTIKEYGFGLCHKMQARILFTNSSPVVFNSATFHIQGARK
ncbi:MAG: hypothetical protein LBH25_09565 [Fibromonadaceae bacterium]|jgi:hypothetical protein|nr:hypothetical protein [Fibromonadaceae bacterium]